MRKEKYAIFTMDVEAFADTECVNKARENLELDVLDGFDEYVNLLDKHDIKGTFFTVADLVPQMHQRIDGIVQNGHKLALHGVKHVATLDIDEQEFRKSLSEAKDSLGKMFNTEVVGFRAPFFSIDTNRLNILKELGFQYDSSHLGFSKARHTVQLDFKGYDQVHTGILKDRDFMEFSLCKDEILGMPYPVSGGGYIRLGNWPFMKSIVKRYIHKNDYYVFYLHPFELTKQKIPFFKNMKMRDRYYLQHGIKTYAKHIEQIIVMLKKEGYRFVTFEELAQIVSAEATCR